jgi:NTP pyrophosphatase (non-canonical NTP hydrolase)
MNDFMEYKKIANVKAKQMDEEFEVKTLEGTLKGNAGDYLCVGINDEQWPVKKEIFETTYRPVQDEEAVTRSNCVTKVWDEVLTFNCIHFPFFRDVDEIYYSNAIAGEVGELCNMIKHRAGGGTNKKKPSNHDVMLEIADIFIYIELLIEKYGLDVETLANYVKLKTKINYERMEFNGASEGTL